MILDLLEKAFSSINLFDLIFFSNSYLLFGSMFY